MSSTTYQGLAIGAPHETQYVYLIGQRPLVLLKRGGGEQTKKLDGVVKSVTYNMGDKRVHVTFEDGDQTYIYCHNSMVIEFYKAKKEVEGDA